MASELSLQISKLRNQNLQSSGPIAKGRPSLFLSSSEAAGVDIEQIFDAAINGFMILTQYDPSLLTFVDGIMHHSSVTLQRESKNAAENQALNKELSLLLCHLSIFALESPTHQVIEYLIRRYRIHELNSDALIKCLLPNHDSKVR